jgi:MFS family permease
MLPGRSRLRGKDGPAIMTTVPSAPPPVSKRELYTVFAGLMLALTLASLDQNIVSTALPRIVSDLGGLAHLSWVVTAFMVASTTTTPLYGNGSFTSPLRFSWRAQSCADCRRRCSSSFFSAACRDWVRAA